MSPSLTITDHEIPNQEELVRLYNSVGWSTYTADPERLHLSMARSLRVVSAREGDKLVGLARVVGDGMTIVYIQDILVDPEVQRRGVGGRLMREVLAPFQDVRQQVLLTDDEPGQRTFYESFGFTEIRDEPNTSLRAFIRISPGA